MATLELDGLVKRYGDVTAVDGVSLSVEAGEFCVFVGPSGCGKSTLLRMISGLEPISDGELRIAGKRMNEVGAADRGLAMVFQSYALYPHMTVRQNLSFGLENLRAPKAEIATRVAEAARMLQIEPLLERKPKALSGGQRQRVAIGRAVVREPTVFLFDEPLSNLDAELRVEMRAELAALHRRVGATMVYVTHDQVEAMTMADRIAVLRAGALEQFGDPLTLYNRPANRFVAGFIGSPRMNFLPAAPAGAGGGDGVAIEGGAVVAPPAGRFAFGAQMELGVRPADLRLTEPGQGALTLELTGVEQLGAECYLQGRTPRGAAVVVHQPGQTGARPGETVGVDVRGEAAHLFDAATGASLRRVA